MTDIAAAPAAPQSSPDTSGTSFDRISESIAKDAIAKTLAEQGPKPLEGRARDDKGKLLPAKPVEAKVGETIPAEGAESEQEMGVPLPGDAATEMGEPAPADAEEFVEFELPEGLVVPKAIEGRAPATAFTVLDHEGEFETPDLMIRFKANGKDRTEPLDKVVHLAQMGVYNEAREETVKQTRAQMEQQQAQYTQVYNYALQLEQERARMLTSDDEYLRARAQFQAQNTPEAQLRTAQQQVQVAQQQAVFQQAAAQGQRFFESEIVPTVSLITEKLPLVGADEIAQRLDLVTRRFEVHTPQGSIVDPRHHDTIRQLFLSDVLPWAQQVQDAREQDRTALSREAASQTRAAQVEAQRAKSLVGRATKPTGRAGAGTSTSTGRTSPSIKTVDDAERSVIRSTLAAMGMGSE